MLTYAGAFLGCGFCGTMVPAEEGTWPDCCPKMLEWKRRFTAGLYGPDYVEEPPLEVRAAALRFERVVRRWESKHAHD